MTPLASLPALFARRAGLAAQGTTFYRAAHTTETGGRYALDVAGDAGVLSLYADLSPAQEAALAEDCAQVGELRSVYLKRRPPEARHLANVAREWLSPPGPVWGEPQPEVTVLEAGVPYLIRPGADLSLGLFSDARPARAWVRANAPERVLNTFAYTCGFGLSAALGGAGVVKNVDLSRKVLAGRGRDRAGRATARAAQSCGRLSCRSGAARRRGTGGGGPARATWGTFRRG